MSSKRDQSDLDDGEIPEEPETKRPRKDNHRGGGHGQHNSSSKARQSQNSATDPTWGQKYVFSSYEDATTIPVGEESDFEDDADAMSYLMSVRQEALGIPHLLVAPKVQIGPQLPAELESERQQDSHGDDDDDASEDVPVDDVVDPPRGWYEDGAYIAAPDEDVDDEYDSHDDDGTVHPRAVDDAYFTSVLSRYERLRTILNTPPPSSAVSRLPPSTPTDAPPFGRNSPTTATWSRALRRSDPHPVQVALMGKDAVLRVLRVLLGGKFLRQGHAVEERTSRWLWALLARLPERGGLNHAEMGWVRDLGRRAVLLSRSLAEMAALREELEEEDGEVEEDLAVDDDDVDGTQAAAGGGGGADEPNGVVDDDEHEEGEVDEDVPMDIESNSSSPLAGDGDEEEEEEAAPGRNLEDVKARLLARLDQEGGGDDDDYVAPQEAARQRARMNMRATLNMVLTVAGEFYGQRDLLEFREPFVGM